MVQLQKVDLLSSWSQKTGRTAGRQKPISKAPSKPVIVQDRKQVSAYFERLFFARGNYDLSSIRISAFGQKRKWLGHLYSVRYLVLAEAMD